MEMKGKDVSVVKIIVGVLLFVFLLGCQVGVQPLKPNTEPTPTLQGPAHTPTSIQPPSGSIPPTSEPLPLGLIRAPVDQAASQTAADLFAAQRDPVDYYRLAVELKGMDPEQLVPEGNSNDYKINDRTNFFINTNLAGDYRAIPFRLRHLTPNAAWWTSVTSQISESDITAAARRFEEDVIPINRLIFGKEWSPGIDGDPRIHILLVEEPRWGGIFGYFSMLNQYPVSIFPHSNQREMFYVNVGAVRMDSTAFAGELAHEYQHLIHWHLNPNQDLWLNEAMGELAIFLQTSTDTESIHSTGNLQAFAERPYIQLTSRPARSYADDRRIFAHYGSERLFAVYLLEQFGPRFIKDKVNNPAPGVIGLQKEMDRLPGNLLFKDVFATWLVANLINWPDLAQGQFGYQEIRPAPPVYEVIRATREQKVADRLLPYGARYYQIQGDGPVNITFRGSTLARLMSGDPPSGRYVWYSNRGDETEFSLTRPFDLTNLPSATLKFKIWYDLEEYYDFGYVQVSTDGGETWKILDTQHGTDHNPRNTSYGRGYTGTTLQWQQESLDLTPYVGNEILIRFHVITDFTTNQEGLQLDDIEIPEIGFFDSAEDDAAGWEARGFVRSSNFVPVEWIVWLIKFTNPIDIQWIEVNQDQEVEFVLEGVGDEFPYAALVVSPTAPLTTKELDYELIFEP
jgi:immune inhibitor A